MKSQSQFLGGSFSETRCPIVNNRGMRGLAMLVGVLSLWPRSEPLCPTLQTRWIPGPARQPLFAVEEQALDQAAVVQGVDRPMSSSTARQKRRCCVPCHPGSRGSRPVAEAAKRKPRKRGGALKVVGSTQRPLCRGAGRVDDGTSCPTGRSGIKITFAVMHAPAVHEPPRVSPRNVAQTPSISSSVGSGGTAT